MDLDNLLTYTVHEWPCEGCGVEIHEEQADARAPEYCTACIARDEANDPERIPTKPEGVPVTMRKMVFGDELDAELAQHAEAGR